MGEVATVVERTFVPDPEAVQAARRFVAEVLGPHPSIASATLAVSELATDAVQGARPFSVRVWLGEPVRVEVEGAAQSMPSPDVVDETDQSHYVGRALVERVALAWGTMPTALGKVVWVELDAAELSDWRRSNHHG